MSYHRPLSGVMESPLEWVDEDTYRKWPKCKKCKLTIRNPTSNRQAYHSWCRGARGAAYTREPGDLMTWEIEAKFTAHKARIAAERKAGLR